MFLIRILRWLFGWIRLEAEGGFPERLLNLAAREDIDLWGIRRRDITLSACCPARQYRRLRSPARRAGMRMHVTERHGSPFFIHRYRARSGLLVGLVISVLLLRFLSSRVWVIEVRGNEKVDSETIAKVMEGYGVREGADLSHLDINALQIDAMNKLPDLSWCVVNLQGSIAYIEVTERVPKPEINTTQVPSNIKSTADGRILSVEVYSGQAMVKTGDAVVKGMLLVSGVVESKVGAVLQRSQAKILAQTTHTLEVTLPLTETKMLPTGRVITRPSLHFFSLDMPWYTDGPIDGEYTLVSEKNRLQANGIHLPLGISFDRYVLLAPTEVIHTQEEAYTLTMEALGDKLNSELKGAEITASDIKGEVRDGVYVLTGNYTCVENICAEEPLLFGGSQ